MAKKKTKKVTAKEVLEALEKKHASDVFVPECKMGSSWARKTTRRLDAWAMAKSWSPWRTVGYEIKVSRSDFTSDDKWPSYLPCCHELWFACPAKLIQPEELGDDVGLLWMYGSGRLVTKKRAPRREPEPEALLSLMSYVLMSRTRVVANMFEANAPSEMDIDSRVGRTRWWEKLLEEREWMKGVGCRVRGKIAQEVARTQTEVELTRRDVERKEQGWQKLREKLRESGVPVEDTDQPWMITKKLEQLRGAVPAMTLRQLERTESALAEVRQRLEEIREGT